MINTQSINHLKGKEYKKAKDKLIVQYKYRHMRKHIHKIPIIRQRLINRGIIHEE